MTKLTLLRALLAAAILPVVGNAIAGINSCDPENNGGGGYSPVPNGTPCEDIRITPRDIPPVWRMNLPTRDLPNTPYERRLDIDLKVPSSDLLSPVPGGSEVELAHMVIGSGNSEIRLPIRLKRQGTLNEPGVAYDTWVDAQQWRPYVIPETTVGIFRVLTVSLKVVCNTDLCIIRMLDHSVTPAAYIMTRMVPVAPGTSVALEFGMKAGYTTNVPVRARVFRPYNF